MLSIHSLKPLSCSVINLSLSLYSNLLLTLLPLWLPYIILFIKMVCSHSFIFCQRYCYFVLLFLFILSTTQVRYKAEGRRPNHKSDSFSKTVNEEKEMLRAQVGSRPPRCERRCSSCGHCEAIQVPTNPQLRNKNKNSSTSIFDVVAYARGDGNSNYKPMSWKCKCGNFIFNP